MNFDELVGKTLKSVDNKNDEQLIFTTTDDEKYMLYHEQDCCEKVLIEEIYGDLSDIVGSIILVADEIANNDMITGDLEIINDDMIAVDLDLDLDSYTWTFYKIDTIKGGVTIRWLGTSTGYYSEAVDFCKIDQS